MSFDVKVKSWLVITARLVITTYLARYKLAILKNIISLAIFADPTRNIFCVRVIPISLISEIGINKKRTL